jgi:cysteine desulfurase
VSRIYLDHNATTPLHPHARAAMAPFLDEAFGNPSSSHAEGRAARDALERARDQVAALVGAGREEILFTSGGTEANNLAVRGLARAARAGDARRRRVLASAVEHPSVLASLEALAAEGFAVERLRVDAAGRLDPDELARRLDGDVALVTVQLANHELGTLQPIAELAVHARAAGALIHSDAVQAAGKIVVHLRVLGVDAATLSAHKIYGPKGAGALYLAAGRAVEPLLVGGHQERERRPGTENVAALVGFGAAARLAGERRAEWAAHTARLRDRLEAGVRALGARISGGGGPRVPGTTNFAFDGVAGELLAMSLDLEGVAVSTGAACTSGSIDPSAVLMALGHSRAEALAAVRCSLGWANTDEEIDRVLALLPGLVARIREA